MTRCIKSFAFLIALTIFSGCSLTPDYQKPQVETPEWREAQASPNAAIAADWWKNFKSAELNALMARQKELVENHQQTVLVAFQEAKSALKKA